jgi:methionyl-tRNA formyltransferase
VQIDRQVRALNPWPGCWTDGLGQRLLVLSGMPVQGASPGQAEPGSVLDDALSIACGEGVYRITRLQRAGGKPMTTSDFLRGLPVSRGIRLGASCPATS